MRTFKIIVITVLLLVGVAVILAGLQKIIPGQLGPSEDEFAGIYQEDKNELNEVNDIYSKQMKQLKGTVKPLGVSIYGEGTHRLENNDQLVVILESNKINLPDFEEKEVQVRGFVRDTKHSGQKIMDVSFIEILADTGVKKFDEIGYEFLFSYPADWDVKKERDKVTFFRKLGDKTENLMIVYQFEDIDQPLDIWMKDRDQNLFYEETKIKVGSVTGIRRIVRNGDQEIIKSYVKEGNNAYELRLISQDEVIRTQYFSIVDFFQTSSSGVDEVNGQTAEEKVIGDEVKLEEKPEEKNSLEQALNTGIVSEDPSDDAGGVIKENTSAQSFTDLIPLSATDIAGIIEKGLSTFQGRTLTFGYPKAWYFSYLGDGKYGFTDDKSFKNNDSEVTEEISRILIISGALDISCTYRQQRSLSGITYTVCSREPGLNEIIDAIADSIQE